MSRTVDNRVVEMNFDNKQFEQAVKQSRQSIKLMEKDLSVLEGAKALANLDKAIAGVDFSNMAKSLETIKSRFSTLGIVGMSVINKLTTDAMTGLNNALHKVTASINGVFEQVYQKGLKRATNLEHSAFQIEGILERAGTSEVEKYRISSKLSKMISDSVEDTAFGLDEASLAAGVLASTYGTSEQALLKIDKTLKGIAGVAGTTGAAYEQVADIFEDASGRGYALGNEFNRMAILGVNASEEVARYANKNLSVQKQLNKYLGQNAKKTITGADILDLASKKKISADLFASAFEGFIVTAKEANETMEGVTSNIGAAMGRLGALFIRPIVQNRGPLVDFLNQVKRGVSDFAKALDKVHIPEYITNFINEGIDVFTGKVSNFLDQFEKGLTPINNVINEIGKAVDKITLVLSLVEERVADFQEYQNNPTGMYTKYLNESLEADEYLTRILEKDSKKNTKTLDEYLKIVNKKHNNWSKEKKEREAERQYMAAFQKEENHSLDRWNEFYKIYYKQKFKESLNWSDAEKSKKALEAFLSSSGYEESVKNAALEAYHQQLTTLATDYDRLSDHQQTAQERMEETNVFGYNYLSNFIDGFKNIVSGIASVFKTIAEAIIGANGPLSTFFSLLTGEGDEKDARKRLNEFSESFKEGTEKIKDFLQNNEGLKLFFSTIAKYIGAFLRVAGAVGTVVWKLITTLAPLAAKIFDTIGKVFGLFDTGSGSVSLLDKVVDALCIGIEYLGVVLNAVWDKAVDIVKWLNDHGFGDAILAIKDKIVDFAKYMIDNWPSIWDKACKVFSVLGGWIKKIAGFFYTILKPAIDFIKPLLGGLADKVYDLTDGFIDLKKPIKWIQELFGTVSGDASDLSGVLDVTGQSLDKVDTAAKNVKKSVEAVSTGFASMSGIGGKGKPGSFLNDVKFALDDVVEPAEKAEKAIKGINEQLNGKVDKKKEESAKSPLGFIANIVTWLKEKFSKISGEDVKKTFEKLVKIVAVVAGVFVVGKLASGIKQIGDGISNFTAALAGYDTKTTQREAMAKILQNVAIIIGVLIAGIVVLSITLAALGNLPEDKLKRGGFALGQIALIVGGITALLVFLSKYLTGEDTGTGFDGTSFGLGKFSFGNNKYTSRSIKESGFKPLIAIAAIIGVFATAVIAIARAIKKIGEMDENELSQGMNKFYWISVIIGILLLVVLSFTFLILKKGNSNAAKASLASSIGTMLLGIAAIIAVFALAVNSIATTLKILALIPAGSGFGSAITIFIAIAAAIIILIGVVMFFVNKIINGGNEFTKPAIAKTVASILGAIALIIVSFGGAVSGILLSLSVFTVASKIGSLTSSIVMFVLVGGAIISLVAVIFIFINKLMQNSGATGTKLSKVYTILNSIALIIFLFGKAVKDILNSVLKIAVISKLVGSSTMLQVEIFIGVVMGIIVGLVAVLMWGLGRLAKNASAAKLQAMAPILLGIGLIIGVVALTIYAIGYAAKNMTDVDPATIGMLALAIGAIGLVVAVIGVLLIIAGKANLKTGPMWALVAMIAVLALLFTAIGVAVAKMSEGGDPEKIGSLLLKASIAIGILIGICALVALVASKFPGMNKGLLMLSVLVAVLALLFSAIGKMVLNIGKGADLLQKALTRFMLSLTMFKNIKDGDIKAGMGKVSLAIETFLLNIIDSFIAFGKHVEERREDVRAAIDSIFGIITDAIHQALLNIAAFILDGLGVIIDSAAKFLTDHGEQLKTVLIKIGDIIWDVLEHFILRLTIAFPNWLMIVADTIMAKAPEVSDKLVGAGLAMINGLINGIVNHRQEIIDTIWRLLKEIVNIIFSFFGLEIPFPETSFNPSAKSNLEKSGEEIDESLGKGVDKKAGKITNKCTSFIGNLLSAMIGAIKNGIVNLGEAWGNALYDALHPDEALHGKWTQEYMDPAKRVEKLLKEANREYRKLAEQNAQAAASGVKRLSREELKNQIMNSYDDLTTRKMLDYWANPQKHKKANGEAYDEKEIIAQMVRLAQLQKEAYEKQMGINSPSKVTTYYGEMLDKGFAVGMNSGYSVNAAKETSKKTTDTYYASMSKELSTNKNPFVGLADDFKTAIPKVHQVLQESGLFNNDKFKITPSLDLTNVKNDTGTIQTMFDNLGLGVNVDGAVSAFGSIKSGKFSTDDISGIANSFDSASTSSTVVGTSGNEQVNVNFTQNNYSPEALSQIDLYRQTETLIGKQSTLSSIATAVGLSNNKF